MSLESRIIRKREQSQMRELYCEPTKTQFPRVLAKTEREEQVKTVFLCVHKKHYFVPCASCKRDNKLAAKHEQMYLRKLNLS